METTNLLYGVLRSLGYQVYPTAGRVSHQASMGLSDGLYQQVYVVLFFACSSLERMDIDELDRGHMVLIVTINGDKYMVWVSENTRRNCIPY